MKLRDHTDLLASLRSQTVDHQFDRFGEMIRRMDRSGISPLTQWRSMLGSHLEMRDEHIEHVARTLSSLPDAESLIDSCVRDVPVSAVLFRAFAAHMASINPEHWLAEYTHLDDIRVETVYDAIYDGSNISVGYTLNPSFESGVYRLVFIEKGIHATEVVRLERKSATDAVLIPSSEVAPPTDSYLCPPFLLIAGGHPAPR